MKNTSIYDKVGKNFTLKILKNIRSMLDKACNLYNVNFVLYATNSNYVTNRFYEIDTKYHLGKIKEYTNLFGFDQSYNYLDRLKIEQEYQNLTNGGSISKVLLKEIENDKQFIDNIYNTILYVEIEN
jgi:anaerobic ribonucleoside-triphosphate reductase